MRRAQTLRVRWGFLFLLAGLSLYVGVGARKASDPGMPSGAALFEEGPRGVYLLNVSYRMADESLAIREQVDFLLTPALLVQEAISDDVVLTYPEE